MTKQSLTIGILGGLGPQTTLHFMQRLLLHCQQQGAVEDHDFPPLLVRSAGHPALTECGISDTVALKQHLITEVQALDSSGADIIAMPCNTIHCYFDELQAVISAAILNMTELTTAATKRIPSNRPGLLATRTTIEQELYTDASIETITPDNQGQSTIETAIRDLMADPQSQSASDAITAVSLDLIKTGADSIILGCTELGVAASRLQLPVPVLDSVDILAAAAANFACNGLPGTTTATAKPTT